MSELIKIYPVPERELPAAFTGADMFARLTRPQAEHIRSRLRYIEEIPLKIDEWVTNPDEEFREFLDEIELDLAINQGGPSADREATVSAWLIHTSWTFGTSAASLRTELSKELISSLNERPPDSNASLDQFRSWLSVQSSALKQALSAFYGSQTYPGAIAHLLALDAILANLFAGFVSARLNPRLS